MAGAQRRQSRINRTRARQLDWRLGIIFAVANLILVARAIRFVLTRVRLGKAEPAFRRSLSDRSLDAMEKPVRSQDTSDSMWPVRSGDPREQPGPLTGDAAMRSGSEPAHDLLDRGVTPSIFQPAKADSDPARWLKSSPDGNAGDGNGHAAPEDVQVAASLENSKIKFAPPKLPEWFWGGSSEADGEATKPAAPENGISPTTEAPSGVASRLSALRGAVSALGMKNLGRRKELPVPNREASSFPLVQGIEAAPGDGAPTAAALAAAVQEQPADARTATEAVPVKAIEAEPQTMAPREFVPLKKRETADAWNKDEVRILPARRGQYDR